MKKKQTATSGMEWNTALGLAQRLKEDRQTRDYLLIVVGCYFGLRIGDLLSLRWSDVLGKTEVQAGESRRNENVQFSLIDNKETQRLALSDTSARRAFLVNLTSQEIQRASRSGAIRPSVRAQRYTTDPSLSAPLPSKGTTFHISVSMILWSG